MRLGGNCVALKAVIGGCLQGKPEADLTFAAFGSWTRFCTTSEEQLEHCLLHMTT